MVTDKGQEQKPYMRWLVCFRSPWAIKGFKTWGFYKRTGQGITVVRLLGVTIRVIKDIRESPRTGDGKAT